MKEKKRILFIDDERNVLDGLRRMLYAMRSEWKMEFVTSGSDALEVMEDVHYDIIVSDLRMPEMDGVEFLEKVRDKYPETIRFMLSGCSEQPIQGRASRCVHQFISKPFDADQLKNLISRAFILHDRLKTGKVAEVLSTLQSLPVMPKAYQDVIDALSMPQCSCRSVGKMIALDIGMSAKILQVANSAFSGRRAKIADLVHAVSYLGLKTVEALVLTEGVFSKLSKEQIKRFSVDGIQEHCVRVGVLAKSICRLQQTAPEDSEAAAMAGILHEAGKIVLIAEFGDQLAEVTSISRSRQVPFYEVEQELLGMTHAELGGCLLELWGLPNSIIEAATFHHEPWLCPTEDFSIVSAVYAANVIDHQLCCDRGDGFFESVNLDHLDKLGLKEQWPVWQQLHLPMEPEACEYVG